MRTLEWTPDGLVLLDQTRLPGETVFLSISTVDELVDAITRLAVRGAPALGVVGAFGVVVAIDQAAREHWDEAALTAALERIRACRPTATNLAWGVDQVRPYLPEGREAVLARAEQIRAQDESANRELSRHAVDWLLARASVHQSRTGGDHTGTTPRRPFRVLTHCNAGALAASAWGTGLGVVRELAARDLLELVYVDETRPLLQGSRLTAYECAVEGWPHVVQVDGAAAGTIVGGQVDVAVIGADRIARNGDVANKIGSVGVALACADAGIPLIVAAPWATVDLATARGEDIAIEERSETEVAGFAGVRVIPDESRCRNPAFDVTPARLVSAIATERGVIEPDGSTDLSTL
ncbi:MAG: S-methyl-5-thioribose-1-phosphate isomerase [Actinomycetales bacterium]